jgi:hypothetical protein
MFCQERATITLYKPRMLKYTATTLCDMVGNGPVRFELAQDVKGSCLPESTFMQLLIENLTKKGFMCRPIKEKVGEVHTNGMGASLNGNLGVASGYSDIFADRWNPFSIVHYSKEHDSLGLYRGAVKVAEMANYQRKQKNNFYNIKDYRIAGGLYFEPFGFMTIFGCLGLFALGSAMTVMLIFLLPGLSIIGIIAAIALPMIFYNHAKQAGNRHLENYGKEFTNAIEDFEKSIKAHSTGIFSEKKSRKKV